MNRPQLVLRDYQTRVISELYAAIREDLSQGSRTRCVITAGTGTGKTEMAVKIAADAQTKGRRFTFMVHRDNLVRQTLKRLAKYGIFASAVCGKGVTVDDYIHDSWPEEVKAAILDPHNNHPHPPGVGQIAHSIKTALRDGIKNPVQVISMQTLERRRKLLPQLLDGVVVFDEAHLTSFRTLGREILSRPEGICIGLTATPWRLSKREDLGQYYSHNVLAPLPSWMIEQGFLVRPRYFGLSGYDFSKVGIAAGDFKSTDLSAQTKGGDLVPKAVDEWQRLASDQLTIAFTVDVEHGEMVAEEFNRRGVKAVCVHGGMDPVTEREPIYRRFAAGEIQVIASCEALAEGFDVPAVGCAMLLRPTKSRAKYLQQLGRALRTCNGKEDAIIIDQAGNIARHGFVEDLIESDFALSNPDSSKGEGDAPTKVCEHCQAIVHISVMECPECGNVFPEKAKVKHSSNLVELKARVEFPEESSLPEDVQFYRTILKQAYNRGWSPGTAFVKYQEKYGRKPGRMTTAGACLGPNPSPVSISEYWNYLAKVASRKADKDPEQKYKFAMRYLRAELGKESADQLVASGQIPPSLAFVRVEQSELLAV